MLKNIGVILFCLLTLEGQSEDKTIALKVHNDARKEVGVKPLIWSDNLEIDAKKYAGPIEAIIESLQDPQCKEIGTLQLCPVDVPWIKSDVFISLEERLEDKDVLIMPHDGERSQPLLALIRPGPVLELLKDGQESPLTEQFSILPHSLLIEDPKLLKNVNQFFDLN